MYAADRQLNQYQQPITLPGILVYDSVPFILAVVQLIVWMQKKMEITIAFELSGPSWVAYYTYHPLFVGILTTVTLDSTTVSAKGFPFTAG